jgi:hypothetical protein
MGIPVTKVEFGFTQSAGAYVYQDITSFVRSVDVSRGVSRELDQFQAGSCTVILDNNLRTFDPSYTSSPYYGEVKPQAAVRITSGNIIIFTGFVDNWSFDYQIVADATATLVAYDSISRLNKTELNAFTWSAEKSDVRVTRVLDKTEVSWPAGARQISEGTITLGADSVSTGTTAWDYIQTVAQSEGGAAFVTSAGDVAFKGQSSSLVPNSVTTYRTNLCLNPSFEGNATSWAAGTRSLTRAYSQYASLQGATFAQYNYLPPVAPETVYGVLYTDSSTTWVRNTSYTFSAWVYSTVAQTVTLIGGFRRTGGSASLDANFQSVSVAANTWTRLSATQAPGATGMIGFLQITTLANTLYVDAVLIEASQYLNVYFDGTVKPGDTSLISYTSAWSGTTYNSTSTLTIVTTYDASVPNSIVLGDQGGTAIPYTDVAVVYASETLYNNVVVGIASGTATTTNASLGTAYGIRTYTVDPALVADVANGTALANYLLGIYDNPQLRFDSITVALEALEADEQVSVLNSDIWSAATITYTPSAIGSAISAYQRIVGVNHSITPDTHRVSFNLAEYGNKFRLDSPQLGVLDTNVLGY